MNVWLTAAVVGGLLLEDAPDIVLPKLPSEQVTCSSKMRHKSSLQNFHAKKNDRKLWFWLIGCSCEALYRYKVILMVNQLQLIFVKLQYNHLTSAPSHITSILLGFVR
jgi:hypothetical protein